ncbi:tRNA (guanine(10)-N2)-methyltransferase [Smittium mucronatum]|uniref:tRNA (Guanine(10)-N2)-methyltransferase n=1 Tax=Smittium mucronatum TaxID=133383 RepID=A0A1R0H390_9FUNG|nr:tRNA (guanine(10)-N2)-methyltransferase [Smittium mucronatum]
MFQKARTTNEVTVAKETLPFNVREKQKQNSEYSRKVATEIENLVYALTSIVSHSKIQDKDNDWISQESFLIQSKTVLLVKSAENLLRLVSDLKRAYLVSDTAHMLEITEKRNRRIDELISASKNTLLELQKELETAITDLKTQVTCGDSMLPTIKSSGDLLIVKKLSSREKSSLEIGDLVISYSPKDPSRIVIKRVLGMDTSVLSLKHKFLIEGIGRSFALNEQIDLIEKLDFLGFTGQISLSKPDVTLILFVDYGPLFIPIDTTTDANPTENQKSKPSNNKTTKTLKPSLDSYRNLIIGRLVPNASTSRYLVNKYNLKTRKYLGNTSMEAEMSLVTANMAKVLPGHLVYDPFVGTGSFLLVASEYGAYTFGSDIDGRQIRGTAGFRRNVGGIDANIDSYKLGHLILGNFVSDITKLPFRPSAFPCINAIITDPPYGVRAGAKKLGRKSGNVATKSLQLVDGGETPNHLRADYYPPTCEYEMSDVILDLLSLANNLLTTGGRLVFWLPTVTNDYQDSDIPKHPNLKLIANSEQNFGSWSRRLITMEKIIPSEFDIQVNTGSIGTPFSETASYSELNDPLTLQPDVPSQINDLSIPISNISLNDVLHQQNETESLSGNYVNNLVSDAASPAKSPTSEPAHKNFRIKYFNKFE